MPHLDSYLYTQWSGWTSCSQSCLTKRIKRCHFPEICGEKPILEEYKLCYKEGDDCERKYLERLQKLQKKEQHPVTVADTFDLEEEDDHPLSNMTCGLSAVSPGTRIIGGRTAIKGSWPWQVIFQNIFSFCGGVLLSTDWVLTAAHCVRRDMSVRAGEHDVRDNEDTEQQEKVSKTFVHPNYDLVTVESDLALLKMRTPFELNQFVQPICLPQPDYELPYYSRGTILEDMLTGKFGSSHPWYQADCPGRSLAMDCERCVQTTLSGFFSGHLRGLTFESGIKMHPNTVTGWGSRRADTVYTSDVLHQADVPIVPPKECQKAYKGHYIRGNMLCAGYETGNVDSCRGDSGGPLIHKQKDGTWAVYGVTSFGDGCGQKKKFGIYANVVTHLSWIIDIIKSQDEELPDSTGPLGK
ncbi:chymotrypsinogen 2-like [Stegodyphus dumicola]|uniref:chymotrypsinogen 2-like n=1 Tax=Stegodyphus dumicola TaxID=202533 RepID=UPI0015A87821|nr:chymotrypsinogen 2-like [Stegodyphus dumicola]